MLLTYQINNFWIRFSCCNFIANQLVASWLFQSTFQSCNYASISWSSQSVLHCKSILVCHNPLCTFLDVHWCNCNFRVVYFKVDSCYYGTDFSVEGIIFDILVMKVLCVELGVSICATNCLKTVWSQLFAHWFHSYVPYLLNLRHILDNILGCNRTCRV